MEMEGFDLSVEAGPNLNLTWSDVDSISLTEAPGLKLNFGEGSSVNCIVVACSIFGYGFVGRDSHWYDPGYSTM